MTTPPDDDTDIDRISAEATELVVSLMSGAANDAHATHIRAWRAQSPAHERAFAEAVQVWRGFRAAARYAERARAMIHSPSTPGLGRRALLTAGAAAAGLATVAAALRPPLDLWPSLQELSADYRTGKGERRTVDLVPEVRLELNTLTSLAVRSTVGDPGVELIAGEALIESRFGQGRRVSVTALDGVATASDARFNLRCLDSVATFICLGGVVEIRRGGQVARLGPTERLTYELGKSEVVSQADITRATAWTEGLLVFSDRPLNAVVSEVNRYRTGRIIIANLELGRRVVNGTFRIDRLDSFIAQVEQLFGAHATSLPGGVTILS